MSYPQRWDLRITVLVGVRRTIEGWGALFFEVLVHLLVVADQLGVGLDDRELL